MGKTVEDFIAALSQKGRILVLGGLAVIAHGLARATRDADIWFEPCGDVDEWIRRLRDVMDAFPGVGLYDFRGKAAIGPDQAGQVVDRDGVIRIDGLDRPLDVFRLPHNLEADDFDGIHARSEIEVAAARVPDEIDLLVTKEGTARSQDIADVSFLEDKVRTKLCDTLRTCDVQEAKAVFARYADHETCRAALANPDHEVQELGLQLLRRFADAGDPFAREILESRGEENPTAAG